MRTPPTADRLTKTTIYIHISFIFWINIFNSKSARKVQHIHTLQKVTNSHLLFQSQISQQPNQSERYNFTHNSSGHYYLPWSYLPICICCIWCIHWQPEYFVSKVNGLHGLSWGCPDNRETLNSTYSNLRYLCDMIIMNKSTRNNLHKDTLSEQAYMT